MTKIKLEEFMTTDKEEAMVAKRPNNPDYTASAVKLVNPPEVKGLLDEWVAAATSATEAKVALDLATAALPQFETTRDAITLLKGAYDNLTVAIKEFGGYQDVEQGLYALQQTRKTITYDPTLVKELIPGYADKILAQVDTAVLKGLLKGKLITQEQVDQCAVIKESQRFVIEAMS